MCVHHTRYNSMGAKAAPSNELLIPINVSALHVYYTICDRYNNINTQLYVYLFVALVITLLLTPSLLQRGAWGQRAPLLV